MLRLSLAKLFRKVNMENGTSFNTASANFFTTTSANFSSISFKFRPEIWFNDVILTVILLFPSLYFVVAFFHHQTKTKKTCKEIFSQLPLEKKYSVMSKYTCMLIVFVSLLRNLNEIGLLAMDGIAFFSVETNQPNVEAEFACNVLARLSTALFAVGSCLVYLFLWFRQSIIYIQPHLKVLNKKAVRVFSGSVLIIYLMCGVSLFVFYLVTFRYEIDEFGFCESESSIGSDSWSYSLHILIFTVCSITMQFALLWLFVNPLLKRRLWRKVQQSERSCDLVRRIKKAIILAAICVCTDIFAFAVNLLLFEEHANRAIFPFSVNLMINCLAAIACFNYWRQILWPWKIKSQNANFKLQLDKSFATI